MRFLLFFFCVALLVTNALAIREISLDESNNLKTVNNTTASTNQENNLSLSEFLAQNQQVYEENLIYDLIVSKGLKPERIIIDNGERKYYGVDEQGNRYSFNPSFQTTLAVNSSEIFAAFIGSLIPYKFVYKVIIGSSAALLGNIVDSNLNGKDTGIILSFQETLEKGFLDGFLVYMIAFAYWFGLFYVFKKIAFNNEISKKVHLVFSFIFSLLASLMPTTLEFALFGNFKIPTFEDKFMVLFILLLITYYILIISLLARLIFKGFERDFIKPKNQILIRLLKTLHIICLLLDLTLTGALIGIPTFFILWIVQYIIFGERNPFFAFAKVRPYK